MGGRGSSEGRTADGESRTVYCRRRGGGYRSSGSCGGLAYLKP